MTLLVGSILVMVRKAEHANFHEKKNTLMIQNHTTLKERLTKINCGSAFRLSLYPMHHIFLVLFPTMHHISNLENSLVKVKLYHNLESYLDFFHI